MAVYVLDKRGKPLMPCSEKRARLLLAKLRARVHREVPFVIRLVDREVSDCALQPLTLKLDPGSRFTGIALVRQQANRISVLSLLELVHRGVAIRESLQQRAGFRRRRRSQNLRHRAPRFDNRTRHEGWLAPSLQHRVDTTLSWVKRLRRWTPITDLAVERVKFDTQKLHNPEISGAEYQQGTLFGYEMREYLLEKWKRQCVYCQANNIPLQIEHLHAKSQGGSNRISNLALACELCNQAKGKLALEVFMAKKPELLKRLLAQAKAPLRDAAAVNATRNALFLALLNTGLPVASGTGGQTKYNRCRLHLLKTHALDAVCVGEVENVSGWQRPTLTIKATGRGAYQRTRLTAYGFPRGYLTRKKRVHGFQTGDRVKAEVSTGKKTGHYQGRVAVRATGSFNIQTTNGVVQGISYRHFTLIQRADGYAYHQQSTDSLTIQKEAVRAGSRFA
jgi:5-methylcytosine-specific restriction endonuclease McrA